MENSVDLDKMAHYESSHPDLHCICTGCWDLIQHLYLVHNITDEVIDAHDESYRITSAIMTDL